ncbi:hypothetical protein HLB23_17595 [Nocardia uniformis]|uniref:Arsenate reductase n=1 Tax=Nocardia uniformis TaxID=53432 RepID=A0A849BZB5_9NOCA|nr:hypothetical protein [Nocardia uniformis]NNH71654.1 hypothetical protein [Nocardia uniformis]
MTAEIPENWAPDACTLPTAQQPTRVAEFDALLSESVRAHTRPNRTRLELRLAADAVPAARDLAQRESECCEFFTFEFDADGTVMGITVPPGHIDILDALQARVSPAP